jgi:hypothetical protein
MSSQVSASVPSKSNTTSGRPFPAPIGNVD